MIELGIDKFISLNEIKVRQEHILSLGFHHKMSIKSTCVPVTKALFLVCRSLFLLEMAWQSGLGRW